MTGSVTVAWSDYSTTLQAPSVAIVPGHFHLEQFQDTEEDDTQDDTVLISAGEMVGTVEIRSYATSAYQRRHLESAVSEALMSTEGMRGTTALVMDPVSIGGVQWLSGSLCAFELDEASWQEEKVFGSRRYSYIEVDCQFPALVAQRDVPTVRSLQIALSAATTEDLSTPDIVPGVDGYPETVVLEGED
jgi:hypothetical protein